MKKKVSPFKLGLFVLSGAAIVIGGLIWIGAAHLFENTNTYVSFFETSVGGLQTGSNVECLGIKIGRVTAISLVQNGRLARVVMKLESGFEIREDHAAELKMGGLTGGKLLSIVEASEKIRQQTPRIDFPTQYPVIPSSKSTLSQVETALENLYEKFQGIDAQGALSAWANVGRNANQILTSADIEAALNNIRQSSAHLENLLSRIGRPETVNEISRGIDNLTAASEIMRRSGEAINRQIEALPPEGVADVVQRMESAARRTEDLVDAMSSEMKQTLSLFQESAGQINQVLAELEALVQSLRERPGRILRRTDEQEPFGR